jgi:kinesin family protein 18/19
MKFEFEKVFLENDRNIEIYKALGESIESFMAGFNTSVLAYGMTGAGKSHTMFGSQYCEEYKEEGVISMVIKEIIARMTGGDTLKMSFMELYNEQLRDLLVERSDNLGILEDSTKFTSVPELSEHDVENYTEFARLLKSGCSRRAIACTASNVNSSRSHSIIQISYTRHRERESIHSKLFFVDLAGSERATQSKGLRLQ